jgi:hypothetical protein
MKFNSSYAAGFFDGEGCISFRKNGVWPTIRVDANQVDRRPLAYLHSYYGGTLASRNVSKYNPNARDIWVWHTSARIALGVLRDISPYLICKAELAEVAIRYLESLANGTRGRPLTEKEAEVRNLIIEEFYVAKSNANHPKSVRK